MDSLYQHCKDVDKENVILSFKGTISQEVLKDVGTNLRLQYREMYLTAKKVFSIFIELAQNVYHHSADKEMSNKIKRPAGVGLLMVQDFEEIVILSSGNLVDKETAEDIVKRCAYINTLEPEELRTFYKEQRRNPNKKGTGANIGLIDMARKSGHTLGYEIVPIDEANAFFALKITIDKETL